ncbi:hypothetical protein DFQ26_009278 [Actinomortierella ambigua]|nr:hypothetical protein DFQ26_009278 [Actinomortierella ambigua]
MDNNTFYYLGPPPPVAAGAQPGRAHSRASAPALSSNSLSSSTTDTPQTVSDLAPQSTSPPSSSLSTLVTSTTQDPVTIVTIADNGNSGATASDGTSHVLSAAQPSAAAPPPPPPPQPTTGQRRGITVTSSDLLCFQCETDFFRHGPIYQWRKNIDPAQLPPRVITRSNCWYGRGCRTQHNPLNPGHAERLNHICEPSV